jgi:hypothetical protein
MWMLTGIGLYAVFQSGRLCVLKGLSELSSPLQLLGLSAAPLHT